MTSATPVRDGFRVVLRRPALIFAEISWRWCFGAAFWALAVLSFFEYFRSLEVSPLAWLMWKSGLPPLMSQALADTIHGSGFKLLRVAAVLVPGYAALWTFAAAGGRAATLRVLLPRRTVRFRTMLVLSFLRAALTLAGILSLVGAFAIAARSYSNGPGALPHAGRALTILFLVGVLLAYLWSVLNWFLGWVPLLAVVRGEDAFSSLSAAIDDFGQHRRAMIGVNLAFGALHLFAFLAAIGVAFVALGLAGVVPGKIFFGVMVMIALGYFAVADWLYISRLAAYAALIAAEEIAIPSAPVEPGWLLPAAFGATPDLRRAP